MRGQKTHDQLARQDEGNQKEDGHTFFSKTKGSSLVRTAERDKQPSIGINNTLLIENVKCKIGKKAVEPKSNRLDNL